MVLMRGFLDEARQAAHDPKTFIVAGVSQPIPERPDRIDALKAGAEVAGVLFETPGDHGIAPIAAVQSAEYLDFLQTIHARWSALKGAGPEVIPNVHPQRVAGSYPTSPVGQAGWHQADTACPIGQHTWDAAYWSAQTALSATAAVQGGARAAYALCRPPGHHAYADMAGGFCFLNNSAIAAEALTRAGARTAVLDVDVHHGNGTQGIFYTRADVLTVSLHTDPAGFYPFFWGHAHERGEGAGEGANLNLPLPRGTGDDAYLDALPAAFARIAAHGTDALVLALGLDTAADDPFKSMRITPEGFTRIGAAVAGLGLPTVIVQEGGYPSPALGSNLTAFLAGFAG